MTHKPGYAPKWEVLTWPYQQDSWIAIISSFFIFSLLFYGVFLLANDNSYSMSICIMECYKQYFGASTHQWPKSSILKAIFFLQLCNSISKASAKVWNASKDWQIYGTRWRCRAIPVMSRDRMSSKRDSTV